MGEAINSFFNEIMLTEFDNGVIYFTGRDLIAMLIGFLLCLILMTLIESIKSHKK